MPKAPDPQLLLQHAGWLRALVRGLIRGEQEVEDVLQDTWVVALERPPRESGALPAWLARVARNLAFTRGRSASRLARRERGKARPEGMPSTEEMVERAELHRLVVQAVLASEEPYRSTLLMRYFEDLTPKEIARRAGIPPGTVRSRVKRALDRLREQFCRICNGDRDAWCAALLPLALPHSSASSTATGCTLGAIAMSTKTNIALVLLPILGAGLGVAGHATLSERGVPGGRRAPRPPEAARASAEVTLLQRENERLKLRNAALTDRVAVLEANPGAKEPGGAGSGARKERVARVSAPTGEGLDAIDWDGWVPRLKRLVEGGSPTDFELMAGARELIDSILENVVVEGPEVRLSDLLHAAPAGSRLATAALAEAAVGLQPAAREAVRRRIEVSLAQEESRLPKEPLGVERMASVLRKLALVEEVLSKETNVDTAARAMRWIEPLWVKKHWNRFIGTVDEERFVATQLEFMSAFVSLDANGKRYAEDLLGRAWLETKQVHAGLVRKFGRETVRAALLPTGAEGDEEAALALARRRSGFAGRQRVIHAEFGTLQSRYEREFYGSLDEEQRKTYRTVAGSLVLFDLG